MISFQSNILFIMSLSGTVLFVLYIVTDSGKNYIYYATCTKEDVVQKWTRKLVKTSFNNSIFNFVSAFMGGQKLTREEAEELKELFCSEDK